MLDLPQGHWMHTALAKEKARIAKKKPAGEKPMNAGVAQAGQGEVSAPVAGGLNVASKPMPMSNQQPIMPKMGM